MTGRPLRWLLLATHVPASGSGGGMIRYCVELARALHARDDVELHVLCTPEARAFFGDLLGEDRVHLLPNAPVALRSLAERSGPGILRVLDQHWDVVQGAKHLIPRRVRSGVRLLTVHDMNPLDRPGDFGRLKRVGLRGPYLASIRDADLLVCVSAATRARLLAWVPAFASRAAVVHLAPSPVMLAVEPAPVPEVAGRRFVLVVGDSSPRKNLALAFRLWPSVTVEHPDAVLAVVGPPSWGPSQLGAAAPLVADGRVRLLGYRTDGELSWLYRQAAAVLCPSELEGFGLPVVEGAAFGVPVLVSDDPAMGEVSAGGTIRLSPHDLPAWREAVGAALDGRLTPPAAVSRTWNDVAAETVAAVGTAVVDRASRATGDVSTVSGVAPGAASVRVLHVHGRSTAPAALRHVFSERALGWDAASTPVRAPRRLREVLSRTDPAVVVLHGRAAGLLGRLLIRGRRTTVLVPTPGTWGAGLSGLLTAGWERLAARWTSAVLLAEPADAARGVRRRIWVPPFVVGDDLDFCAAVLSRAHAYGGPGPRLAAAAMPSPGRVVGSSGAATASITIERVGAPSGIPTGEVRTP
ncbi:MAG: hypothetical protein JWO98_4398 [Frankiales bacterium]|nr:hypothetical protein [Frankiales bacterium]